jgi:hypothetical protein
MKQLLFSFILIISACNLKLQLPPNQVDNLLKCNISLKQARLNLLNLGYSIQFEKNEAYFSTDYKKSDFETKVGWITKEPIILKYRMFVVQSISKDQIQFQYKYKIHNLINNIVKLENPPFYVDKLHDIQGIRSEVCGWTQTPHLDDSKEKVQLKVND